MSGSEWTTQLDTLVRSNSEVRQLLKYLAKKDLGFVARMSGKCHVIVKNPEIPMCTAAFSLTPI